MPRSISDRYRGPKGQFLVHTAKFPARTVIADFLGDMVDGHPSVGHLRPRPTYDDLYEKADLLLAELERNGITLTTPET